MAANLPINLLIELVKKKLWTPEQGLTYALQVPDPQRKVTSLTVLADCLPQPLKEQALQAALQAAIELEWSRAGALIALADKLPQKLLPEALAAAKAIGSDSYRADALIALADKLPEILPEVLAAARGIQDEYYRANALSALVDKLAPKLLPEALAVAKAIQDEYYRANALSALADKLSKMQTGELFPLWQNTLHSLSLRTRQDLLQDMVALTPVICALGDRAAVAEIAHALQDVGRWWP